MRLQTAIGTAAYPDYSGAYIVTTSRYGTMRNTLTYFANITTSTYLAGYYDIGGGLNDFTDVVSAADTLQSIGIMAPVTFNVYSGTYNGRVNLPGTIFGIVKDDLHRQESVHIS